MIVLVRTLGRLVAFLLLVALALLGLGLAVGALVGLPNLADTLDLPAVRDEVGGFLALVEDGDSARAAVSLGVAVVAILLIAGIVAPAQQRLLALQNQGDSGRLAARGHAVRELARAAAAQPREVERLRLRVRPRRRHEGGGRVRARATTRPDADAKRATERVAEELRTVTEPFGLKARVSARPARRRVA